MLLGLLGTSLLGNILAGKVVIRAGEGVIQAGEGRIRKDRTSNTASSFN